MRSFGRHDCSGAGILKFARLIRAGWSFTSLLLPNESVVGQNFPKYSFQLEIECAQIDMLQMCSIFVFPRNGFDDIQSMVKVKVVEALRLEFDESVPVSVNV